MRRPRLRRKIKGLQQVRVCQCDGDLNGLNIPHCSPPHTHTSLSLGKSQGKHSHLTTCPDKRIEATNKSKLFISKNWRIYYKYSWKSKIGRGFKNIQNVKENGDMEPSFPWNFPCLDTQWWNTWQVTSDPRYCTEFSYRVKMKIPMRMLLTLAMAWMSSSQSRHWADEGLSCYLFGNMIRKYLVLPFSSVGLIYIVSCAS